MYKSKQFQIVHFGLLYHTFNQNLYGYYMYAFSVIFRLERINQCCFTVLLGKPTYESTMEIKLANATACNCILLKIERERRRDYV